MFKTSLEEREQENTWMTSKLILQLEFMNI